MASGRCRGRWRAVAHREVARWLRRHPDAFMLVKEALHELESNPRLGEPLRGRCHGLYRYRKGRLRLVYWLNDEDCTVRVVDVGWRESIYEKLGC
ncbi:MAG: type II toxin-antitoxin system RelE/ParE family toxin [Crenarchaeota archaeon]|nr:type II toxin-antitoxin system RelE/ParE family toxin [Thermoproteota archaeon]